MEHRGILELKIGGKTRTLKFGMNFWKMLCDHFGIKLENIAELFKDDSFDMDKVFVMVYCAAKSYDFSNKNEVDYTIEDAIDWTDSFEKNTLNEIMQTITKSKILGNSMNMGLSRNVIKSTKETKEVAA